MPILIIFICILVFILTIIISSSILVFFFALSNIREKNWFEMEPTKIKGWIENINKVYKGAEYFDSLEMESVSIYSNDGLLLSGKYYPQHNSRNTIICFHGYRSMAKIDFGSSAKFYHDQGFNILFVDQRAGGESQGKFIGMGTLERFDCLKWIEYVNDSTKEEINIYLAGVSMGATTILLATGLGLPENIIGIIADCGYTSPYEIFRHTMKHYFKLPGFPVLSIAMLLFKIKLGYWIKKIDTVGVLKDNSIPVLFIHGSEDNFVPVEMTLKNYEVCASQKEILIVEGAGHSTSYITNPKLYEKAVKEFLWHRQGSIQAEKLPEKGQKKGQEEEQ